MPLLSSARQLANRLLGRHPAGDRDARSGRILLVIECILNQNARDHGAASCPAMNRRLVEYCLQQDVALLQIPCPEIRALGWRRERQPGQSIRAALDTPAGRNHCRQLAQETADRIEQYLAAGYTILGVVGGNEQSPGCAVHPADPQPGHSSLTADSGLLMQALETAFLQRDLAIPIMPLRDAEAEKLERDMQQLSRIVQPSTRGTGPP